MKPVAPWWEAVPGSPGRTRSTSSQDAGGRGLTYGLNSNIPIVARASGRSNHFVLLAARWYHSQSASRHRQRVILANFHSCYLVVLVHLEHDTLAMRSCR